MEHILVLVPFDASYRERTKSIAGDTNKVVFLDSDWDRAAYVAQLGKASVVLGDPAPDDVPLLGKLRLHQTTWAGIEHYATQKECYRDAVLCNMTGAYGPAIAEYCIGVILSMYLRLPGYWAAQQNAEWIQPLRSKTLEGTTALILGAGDIGGALAKRLRPFVQKIIGVRRNAEEALDDFDEMHALDALDHLLPQADIVACCLPDTPATRGLFGAKRFLRMRADAVFVNIGRGNLIDADALYDVLERGHLWGAVLDVTVPEPLPHTHALWRQPRALITPHISGNAFGSGSPTERRIWDLCLRNLENYLQNKPLENVVDFSTGYRAH